MNPAPLPVRTWHCVPSEESSAFLLWKTARPGPAARSSGAKARALITSTGRAGIASALARPARPVARARAGGSAAEEIGAQPARFDQSRRCCSAKGGDQQPGKPAPLPRSSQLRACCGAKRISCAESRIWRDQIRSSEERETRFCRSFSSRSRSTKASSRSSVSRGTSSAACASFVHQAALRRAWTRIAASAAGVMPRTRRGRAQCGRLRRDSLSTISFDRPGTAE